MFVFKAAVVGAGTMGGQIAQTIAAAGIPVVLKDIDDALVRAGLDEARSVTAAQVGKLADKLASADGDGTKIEVEAKFPVDPSGVAAPAALTARPAGRGPGCAACSRPQRSWSPCSGPGCRSCRPASTR